jgi:polyhydroxyalkanoate synthase subunit PhaC
LAQSTPPEALLAAIAQSGNAATQGWMKLLASPPDLQALQGEYLEQQKKLWHSLLSGNPSEGEEDRRFAAREWRENPYYAYLKHSYFLAARYVEQAVAAPLDGATKERARFAARQWIDAMCPANFAATNPSVLKQMLESKGESIARGMANLLADAGRGRISQTDESAFELGRNIATTPGEVVYENDLIQLIQYGARTEEVAKRPLVMIPPCINKYYILDLQPENSLVGYAVDQGHTVFMVSWRNVGPEQGHYGWDDYLELGVSRALRVAQEITKADKVNALGFCVGGTLLGSALAKKEEPVSSVTFLAAMLDFRDTGQIGLFVDEASVATREATIGSGGILPGQDLAFVFSSLRANDLIWPYVVNNYLLGGRPAAFDLLYWNADSTNLPGPMYCYYLRHAYLQNDLKNLYDLGSVNLPMFGLATREDHIVPWRSAYRTLGLLGSSEKHFILGASGHIAGVVNPASKNRRSHWVGSPYPVDADEWLAQAKEEKGSWWPRWAAWLESHGGGKRKAPQKSGNAKYKPIEPAPGRYVRQRIVH